MSALRSLVRLVLFPIALLSVTVLLSIRVGLVPRSERPRKRAALQQRACRFLCAVLGVTVRLDREDPDDGAHLAVSNHLGVLDGFVLASVLPVAFVAKAEMASWPLMGWVCRQVGVIFVRRERRMETTRFVDDVRARIRTGVTVLVFPEGTVGDGASVLPFRTGAFESVAGESDLRIQPIGLRIEAVGGRGDAVWHRDESFAAHIVRVTKARRFHATVRAGRSIPAVGLDRRALADRSHGAVIQLAMGP